MKMNDLDSFAAYLNSTNEKQLIGEILAEKVVSLSSVKAGENFHIFDLGCGSGEISSRIIKALNDGHVRYQKDS